MMFRVQNKLNIFIMSVDLNDDENECIRIQGHVEKI